MVAFRNVFDRVASGLKAVLFPASSQSKSNPTDRRRPRRDGNGDGNRDANGVRLFVGNLPYAMNEGSLRSLFEKYGKVASAEIVTDRATKASRGFGFVIMPSQDEAKVAMSATNGREFDGRAIIVDRAKAKQRQNSESGPRATERNGSGPRRRRTPSGNSRRPDRRRRETQGAR